MSFYVEDIHYNLLVRLLNDRFGVQVRGGCSCAGTYGHYLLHVDPNRSSAITDKIDHGDLSEKPGWVRMSLHPTTTTAEVHALAEAVRACVAHADRVGSGLPLLVEDQRVHPPERERGRAGPRAVLPALAGRARRGLPGRRGARVERRGGRDGEHEARPGGAPCIGFP